jgi:hypothetical protein
VPVGAFSIGQKVARDYLHRPAVPRDLNVTYVDNALAAVAATRSSSTGGDGAPSAAGAECDANSGTGALSRPGIQSEGIGERLTVSAGCGGRFGANARPGSGWLSARAVAQAAERARPPLVVADTYHSGELAPSGAFPTIEPAGMLVVRVVKRAEHWVRLAEPDGRPCPVRIGGNPLPGRDIRAELAPHEVRTLLVLDDPEMSVGQISVTEL